MRFVERTSRTPADPPRPPHSSCRPAKAPALKLRYTKGLENGLGNEVDRLAVDAAGRVLQRILSATI
jgi:hypothetical protein